METLVRQSVGIDIAKATFTACICQRLSDGSCNHSKVESFANTSRGFNQLVKWVRKQCLPEPQVSYVMEATGIYYEPLAYHLHKLQQNVSVVLPNKVKYYAKSLNVKSKTDAIDARVIAQMGAERNLSEWQPAALVYRELRALTRLYSELKAQRTVFSNQLQSMQSGYEPLAFVQQSLKGIISKLDKEITKSEKAIRQHISNEKWLQQKVEKLMTIKGVGFITVAIIVGETQGFQLITSAKQLASYAGYDVVQRESGSSIKGKTRISKKGNSRIRAALHFPALVASRHNPDLAAVYHRINKGKTSKMIGATALQRKILVLLYALWKNDTTYQPKSDNQNNTSGNQETGALLRHEGETLENKTGRSVDLPAQDGLPLNQSTEALLRQEQIS